MATKSRKPKALPGAITVTVDDIDHAPVNLPIDRKVHSAEEEKWRSKFDEVSNKSFELREEIENLKRQNQTAEILNSLIKPYARRSFVFMCVYSAIVGVLIVMHGIGRILPWSDLKFSLPETVLDYLVGSTAVTVIGLVGMVLTGVFVGARKK